MLSRRAAFAVGSCLFIEWICTAACTASTPVLGLSGSVVCVCGPPLSGCCVFLGSGWLAGDPVVSHPPQHPSLASSSGDTRPKHQPVPRCISAGGHACTRQFAVAVAVVAVPRYGAKCDCCCTTTVGGGVCLCTCRYQQACAWGCACRLAAKEQRDAGVHACMDAYIWAREQLDVPYSLWLA